MGSSNVRYPWPSTICVPDFVTVKPSLEEEGETNFLIWEEQMLCLLESQELVGFVNGEIVNPKRSGVESEEKLWRRSDRLVKGWILGSIGKDALEKVWKLETAEDVWLKLHKVFERARHKKAKRESHETGRDEDLSRYLELYQASLRGDWWTANTKFFDKDQAASGAIITCNSETALHAAVSTGKANDFVKRLVELMSPEAVKKMDKFGRNALHRAVAVGNTEAAKTLVDKYPDLLYITNSKGILPVNLAAMLCKEDTLVYLISKYNPNVENSPFQGKLGLELLKHVIVAGYLDTALELVKEFPDLAGLRPDKSTGSCALSVLCERSTLFESKQSFSWSQSFIYHCNHLQDVESEAHVATSDIESVASAHKNCSSSFQNISGGARKFVSIIWKIINLVPQVMRERIAKRNQAKHKRNQALELGKYLCNLMLRLPENEASTMFNYSIIQAAKNGISDMVEVIMDIYPRATFSRDSTGRNVFHIAASYRFENVFNLIYNMSDRKYLLCDYNLLHICAKLAPPERFNLVPGAALQMQRELQWFKEIEKIVPPSHRTRRNIENKTPWMIFTEEHRDLKKRGEEWMKATANACTIAAALIATFVFAAAFTVPGGVKPETGAPIFLDEIAFAFFVISDAVALFTSIISLLMFLSIFACCYAEEDFLRVLPTILIIGLFCLFFSIVSMTLAFSSTIYLIAQKKLAWFIPIPVLACFLAASLTPLQFGLAKAALYSTYGRGIFGKKSDTILY